MPADASRTIDSSVLAASNGVGDAERQRIRSGGLLHAAYGVACSHRRSMASS
jgi:hypothetical protein